ncbi:MAG: T9SS type A sorting domain-containing protein [Aureispira sp.]|nr:T9SS type A sorting domain-containing protein [Aureispira sp.]
MKKILLLFLIFSYTQFTFAAVCTSIGNGNWADPATWDCGRVPENGDQIIIAEGHQVDVDCNCGTYSDFRIDVYGVLYFLNGQKVYLDSVGVIQVHVGARISGDNGGSKIIIAGDTKWRGNEPDIIGPAYLGANNAGPVSGIFPIELIYFSTVLEGKSISVSWATASETNNDFFVVERSLDALTWEDLITIDGAGTSSTTRYYSVLDDEPEFGISYYRLKQTDFDGTTSYSDINSIENNKNKSIVVYSTPFAKTLIAEGHSIGNNAFFMSNSLGQRIPIIYKARTNKITFNLEDLNQGIYIISFLYNNTWESYKVVVP